MRDGLSYVKALFVGKAGDGARPLFTYRASDASEDRHGEVVTLDGWELDNYRANPVILDSHNYTSIRAIIGKAADLRLTSEGLEVDIEFNTSELGQLARQLADEGNLNAVSVGFKPKEISFPHDKGETVKHLRKELLEISSVSVPANANALRLRALGITGGRGIPVTDWHEHEAGSTTLDGRGLVWRAVAAAMATLLTATGFEDDATRRKLYAVLERAYRILGEEAPDYLPVGEMAALGDEEIRGLFYAGEPELFTKAGRVLSAKNEAAIRQIAELASGVLETLGEPAAADDEGKAADAPATLTVGAETLDVLRSFAGQR